MSDSDREVVSVGDSTSAVFLERIRSIVFQPPQFGRHPLSHEGIQRNMRIEFIIGQGSPRGKPGRVITTVPITGAHLKPAVPQAVFVENRGIGWLNS